MGTRTNMAIKKTSEHFPKIPTLESMIFLPIPVPRHKIVRQITEKKRRAISRHFGLFRLFFALLTSFANISL
jgi:hypothetical protein